jgi:FkbM family methyltransferase
MTPYEGLTVPWREPTEKFLGEPVEFEFMRRAPVLIPRWAYAELEAFCQRQHGCHVGDYIGRQPLRAFSEYNAMGAFLYRYHRDKFHWIDTSATPESEWPELTVKQCWSYGGLTDEIRAEFDRILSRFPHIQMAQMTSCPQCAANSDAAFNFYATDRAGGFRCAQHDYEWTNPDEPKVAALPVKDGVLQVPTRSENWQQYLAEPPSPIMQTKEGIWVLRNDSHISRWIEEHGQLQHDFQTLPEVLKHINEGDCVVDVGCFVGDTLVPFANKVGSGGTVYGLEPNPDAYECLILNTSKFCGDNVQIQRAAAGEAHGILNLSREPNAGASFLHKGEGITVDVLPIDAMNLARCNMIKLDCEGYELRALRGAAETIRRFHPKLLIEINREALERQGTHPREIYAWLYDHGYEWREVVPSPDGPQNTPQTDILCEWKPKEQNASTSNFHGGVNVGDSANIPAAGVAGSSQIEPWQSLLETVAEIRRHALALKPFCGKGRRTAKVREELKKAGVIR